MTEFVSCININRRQLYRDFIDTTTKLNISTNETGRLIVCAKTLSIDQNPIYYITIHRLGISFCLGYDFDKYVNIKGIIDDIRDCNDDSYFIQIIKASSEGQFIDLYGDDLIITMLKETNIKLWYHLD